MAAAAPSELLTEGLTDADVPDWALQLGGFVFPENLPQQSVTSQFFHVNKENKLQVLPTVPLTDRTSNSWGQKRVPNPSSLSTESRQDLQVAMELDQDSGSTSSEFSTIDPELVVTGERLSKLRATERLSKLNSADPSPSEPASLPTAIMLPKSISGESSCRIGGADPRKLDSQKNKAFQKIFKSRNTPKNAVDGAVLDVGNGALRALFLNLSDAEVSARTSLIEQIQSNARLTKEIQAASSSLVEQEIELKKVKIDLVAKDRELCTKSKLILELTESYQLNRRHDKAFTVILESENENLSFKNREVMSQLRVARQSALHAERNLVALRSELDQERLECSQVKSLLGESNQKLEESKLESTLLRAKFCCQARADNPQSFDRLVSQIQLAIAGNRFITGGDDGGGGCAPVLPASAACPARQEGNAGKQKGGGARARPKRKR